MSRPNDGKQSPALFCVFTFVPCFQPFSSISFNVTPAFSFLSPNRELHKNKISVIEPGAFNGLDKMDRL